MPQARRTSAMRGPRLDDRDVEAPVGVVDRVEPLPPPNAPVPATMTCHAAPAPALLAVAR